MVPPSGWGQFVRGRLRAARGQVARAVAHRLPTPELSGGGERVDIYYNGRVFTPGLDMYQQSHYQRYRYARRLITRGGRAGDFACGTGYGSMMLAQVAGLVIGVDLSAEVLRALTQRYPRASREHVLFLCADLRNLPLDAPFDDIVSFETVEHFTDSEIPLLLAAYHRLLRPRGRLILSTPYMQPPSPMALKLGFHRTFEIDERRIAGWFQQAGFQMHNIAYQNYATHVVQARLADKDFMIAVGEKIP